MEKPSAQKFLEELRPLFDQLEKERNYSSMIQDQETLDLATGLSWLPEGHDNTRGIFVAHDRAIPDSTLEKAVRLVRSNEGEYSLSEVTVVIDSHGVHALHFRAKRIPQS